MDLKLLTGNVLERLRELPDESVHCVVTSPPYWGLRDYGGWKMCVVWGKAKAFKAPKHPGKAKYHLDLLRMRAARKGIVWSKNKRAHICAYGLEPTPELYLRHTVEIFEEVRRVLRSDGVAWVNLGDSYAGSWSGYCDDKPKGIEREWMDPARRPPTSLVSRSKRLPRGSGRWGGGNVSAPNLKAKDLCGIPWRVAFALQEAGWWLRSDIVEKVKLYCPCGCGVELEEFVRPAQDREVIWAKPNPMPESTSDRPTKAHEYVFMLTKSDRYFYDAEAIREPVTGNAHARGNGVNPKALKQPTGWARNGSHDAADWATEKRQGRGTRPKQNESFSAAVTKLVSSRNRRSVWEIPTYAFPEAHFATFPPDLVKPCILAGTSAKGCCSVCGAPWERVIELGAPDLEHQRACGGDVNGDYFGEATKDFTAAKAQNASAVKARILAGMRERKTTAWRPTCKCDGADAVPCTVLDPFGGSGTTGMVALELGRRAVLVELNPAFAEMIERRCRVTPGLQLA